MCAWRLLSARGQPAGTRPLVLPRSTWARNGRRGRMLGAGLMPKVRTRLSCRHADQDADATALGVATGIAMIHRRARVESWACAGAGGERRSTGCLARVISGVPQAIEARVDWRRTGLGRTLQRLPSRWRWHEQVAQPRNRATPGRSPPRSRFATVLIAHRAVEPLVFSGCFACTSQLYVWRFAEV